MMYARLYTCTHAYTHALGPLFPHPKPSTPPFPCNCRPASKSTHAHTPSSQQPGPLRAPSHPTPHPLLPLSPLCAFGPPRGGARSRSRATFGSRWRPSPASRLWGLVQCAFACQAVDRIDHSVNQSIEQASKQAINPPIHQASKQASKQSIDSNSPPPQITHPHALAAGLVIVRGGLRGEAHGVAAFLAPEDDPGVVDVCCDHGMAREVVVGERARFPA